MLAAANLQSGYTVTAALKASQALASELEREPLLTTLLQVSIDAAGADRGVVLLLQDGTWQIAAIRQMDQSIVFPSSPLETSQDVPIALIETVKRTLNPIVISAALEHPLLQTDPYCLHAQPQSVLCLPLLDQGLSGLLYLENHVIAEAFTSDRVEWLNLLCPQVAIALENARLYQQSQQALAALSSSEANRLAATEALQTSEQNLRAIFNNVSNGILVHDLNGIVQDANDSALRLYQLEREQLPQISVLKDCSAPDNPFHCIPAWWASVLAGEPVSFEWQAKRFRDGTVFDVEVSLTRILLNGEAMILGNVKDVSDRQAALRERKEAEQQLQASQQLLELVFNTIPHKVFWKDCNLVYQGSNRAFGEVVGLTPAEIIGKSDYDLSWTTDESDWFCACDRRVMQTNKPKLGIIETTLQADGTSIWIETSKLPLHDPTGAVIGVLGIYQDITDRKQTEATLQQALQEKEYQTRLLQTVLDSTNAWIFAKDRHFRYIMVNRCYAEAIGQTIEFMLGKDDLELGFPEALVLGDPQKKIRGFRPDDRRVLAGKVIHNPHDPATIADGSLRILDTRKSPLFDTDGNLFAMLGFCHDVTNHKQAEAELRASQQRLSLLIQQTPLAVIEWDAALRVQAWNPAAEAIFGFTAAEVTGQSMPFLLPDATAQFQVDQVMAQLLSQTGGSHNINKNLTKAGKVILCEWYNNPIVENGALVGIATMALDITERHNAETAMRRSKAQLKEKAAELEQTLQELQHAQTQMVQSEKMSGLGQLVAGVAHEINNPVNFIYGNLTHANSYTNDILRLLALYQKHYPTPPDEIQAQEDAIELDFLLEDLPKLLTSMRVGAERIQKIVASLRNFSRMDEAEVKAVNLHDGIDSTLMILQHRLKAKAAYPSIEIIKKYGDLPLVECYAGQLNQVFMNVLSNAIDAIDDQMQCQIDFQPRITIYTALIDATHVRMSFADNGSGIPDAAKSKLFDPFFTTKPVGKGTGMGLSISYQIVAEKHGGSLQCVSVPGQGTAFIIEIPIQQ